MAEKLKDGMDSGRVSEKVRKQLFTDSIGFCAKPKCDNRLMQSRTSLGECAHIIPRKVGSHPREDYETPLEDRKKEPNLLYLCLNHHKLIDDKQHAETYTADLLQKWKKEHETWAAGISKNSPPLPQKASKPAILQLMSACRSYLHAYRLNEARAFLSQINILLLEANDIELNAKADLLGAMLSASNEQIPEAKKQLLEIIRAHPQDIEPMFEYIELCDSAPEPTDKLEKIEGLARELDENHPHLLLINLFRQYKNEKPIEDESIFDKKVDDPQLAARLLRWHSLFCDIAGKTKQRDALVDKWQKTMPDSPNPHLHKVMYKTLDIRRNPPEQAKPILDAIEFSKKERQATKDKAPLTPRGEISWLLEETRLHFIYAQSFGMPADLTSTRDTIISRIEQCYFDNFINNIVSELLQYLHVEPDQWRMIVSKIQASKVIPSKDLIQGLFLHALKYDELSDDLVNFVEKGKHDDLLKILQAIKNSDAPKAAKLINAKKNSDFSLILLHSILNYDVAAPLTELLEIEQDSQLQFLAVRLGILVMQKQDRRALELITEPIIDQVNLFTLHTIEEVAYRNEQWHLFIPAALRLLTLNIDDTYKAQLHGKLAMFYFGQKDDANAIAHAEQALIQPEKLGEANSHNILSLLVRSFMNKGQANKACDIFKQYPNIKTTFQLLGLEATCYLESNFNDKHQKALSLTLEAFEIAESYNDRLYMSAFMLLVTLGNAGVIPARDEPTIKDGLFVKLDGLPNWLYIGEQAKSLGAECIGLGTNNYKALIGKSVNQGIIWPPDQFLPQAPKREILHIATPACFLARRAHEAIMNAAQLGDGVWRSEVTIKDGKTDISTIKKIIGKKSQSNKKILEDYASKPMPFAILCCGHGGFRAALGMLQSEEIGFIRCNDSMADIAAQKATANDVLNGAPCFIEGLAAVVLAESELLEDVIKAVPNLGVSASVIGLLRDIAGELERSSGSVGSATLVEGKIKFYERDKERQITTKNRFFTLANLLDKLPERAMTKIYSKSDKNLDSMLPNYFVDALRYAQEKETHILTDDFLFVHAYEKIEETPMPRHFSSISLIRAMTDKGLIPFQSYLEYFALLSIYRYRFLSFSVDDMINAVLPRSKGGVLTPVPENISLLNLSFTLSQDYGVEEKNAVAVLLIFFMRLALDNSVTPEIADKIFGLTLAQVMEKRDKKSMAVALRRGCRENMTDERWISQSSKKKLEMLDKHLFRIATLSVQYPKLIPPDQS